MLVFENVRSEDFFRKYNLSENCCDVAGISWEQVVDIAEHHALNIVELETTANDIAARLRRLPQVHSLKFRVKNPEHLAEKIIRKRIEDREREITLENYTATITDLIGVRALHLFKEEWKTIHDFIMETWDIDGVPVANIREGDPEQQVEMFTERGCEIKVHPAKYRSVHYRLKSRPTRKEFIAELQVRTIFEEGWSEIDHRIRYPYNLENTVLNQFLTIFNRLAGQADEMGSFITILAATLEEQAVAGAQAEAELGELKQQLEEMLKQSSASNREKVEMRKRLDQFEKAAQNRTSAASISHILPPTLGQQAAAILKFHEESLREMKYVSAGLSPGTADWINSVNFKALGPTSNFLSQSLVDQARAISAPSKFAQAGENVHAIKQELMADLRQLAADSPAVSIQTAPPALLSSNIRTEEKTESPAKTQEVVKKRRRRTAN